MLRMFVSALMVTFDQVVHSNEDFGSLTICDMFGLGDVIRVMYTMSKLLMLLAGAEFATAGTWTACLLSLSVLHDLTYMLWQHHMNEMHAQKRCLAVLHGIEMDLKDRDKETLQRSFERNGQESDEAHTRNVAALVLEITTQHSIELKVRDEKIQQHFKNLSSTRSDLEKTKEENARLNSESGAVETKLRAVTEDVEKHKSVLKQVQQDFAVHQVDYAITLEAKENVVGTLQAELGAKNEEMTALQHRCATMATDLGSLQADLSIAYDRRGDVEAELSSIRESHSSHMASWDRERQVLNDALDDAAAQLSKMNGKLQAKELEVHGPPDEIEKLQLEVEQLREENQQKDLDLRFQHDEIESKDARLEEMTDQLVLKNRQLADSDIKLAKVQKALREAPTKDDLDKKHAELDAKDKVLGQKNAEIESLRKKLDDAPREADLLAKDVQVRDLTDDVAMLVASKALDCAEQASTVQALRTEIESLGCRLAAAPTIDDLDAKNTELLVMKKHFDSQATKSAQTQSELDSVRIAMAAELEKLQAALAKSPTRELIQERDERIASLTRELSSLNAAKAAVNGECEELKRSARVRENDYQHLRTTFQKLMRDKLAESTKLRHCEAKLEKICTENVREVEEAAASRADLIAAKNQDIQNGQATIADLRKLCNDLGAHKDESVKAIQDKNTRIATLESQIKILQQFSKVPAGPRSMRVPNREWRSLNQRSPHGENKTSQHDVGRTSIPTAENVDLEKTRRELEVARTSNNELIESSKKSKAKLQELEAADRDLKSKMTNDQVAIKQHEDTIAEQNEVIEGLRSLIDGMQQHANSLPRIADHADAAQGDETEPQRESSDDVVVPTTQSMAEAQVLRAIIAEMRQEREEGLAMMSNAVADNEEASRHLVGILEDAEQHGDHVIRILLLSPAYQMWMSGRLLKHA